MTPNAVGAISCSAASSSSSSLHVQVHDQHRKEFIFDCACDAIKHVFTSANAVANATAAAAAHETTFAGFINDGDEMMFWSGKMCGR